MSDPDLGDWKPKAQVIFSDEEIITALRQTQSKSAEQVGNIWSFFRGLPKPEQQRLEAEASRGK